LIESKVPYLVQNADNGSGVSEGLLLTMAADALLTESKVPYLVQNADNGSGVSEGLLLTMAADALLTERILIAIQPTLNLE